MKKNTHHEDSLFLLKALSVATFGRGGCSPNPAVGTIIVNASHEIIATGYHTGPGKAHAEIEALQKLSHVAKDTTIYVTLEPCAHTGRTPPCTDALIKSGAKRIVYGYRDPNPIVSGKGAKALTDAGIICDHIPLPEINNFYESYHHWHKTKTPFITAKLAMTLDGKIAGEAGARIQITGEALQEFTHHHRKATDAILTTAETIKKDNPKLNARYQNETILKQLYVLDSQLTLSPESAIFKTTKSITLFHTREAKPKHQKIFEQLNIRCIPIDKDQGGLNLQQVIQQIGNDGIHDLWIEAGGKCFSAFLESKLVQRALIYIAPLWLGKGMAAFSNHFSIANLNPTSINWQQIGSDGVLEMRF